VLAEAPQQTSPSSRTPAPCSCLPCRSPGCGWSPRCLGGQVLLSHFRELGERRLISAKKLGGKARRGGPADRTAGPHHQGVSCAPSPPHSSARGPILGTLAVRVGLRRATAGPRVRGACPAGAVGRAPWCAPLPMAAPLPNALPVRSLPTQAQEPSLLSPGHRLLPPSRAG